MTFIASPRARLATIEPILPQPMMPSVLAVTSTPMNFGLLPFAGLGGAVGLGELAGERHQQRDGVLGGGDGIAEGRVHHDDALGGRGGHVDIVDADAGAADHAQPAIRLGQHLLGHLGRRADGEPVIIADDGGEVVLVEAGLGVGFDAAVGENLAWPAAKGCLR